MRPQKKQIMVKTLDSFNNQYKLNTIEKMKVLFFRETPFITVLKILSLGLYQSLKALENMWTKGCFTKNQDFHFFDSVKFVLVIERIKGFDHDLVFLWVSKRKILIQKFFWQISRIQSIATQRFFKFWQKLSISKIYH